jgi:PelA/Pel-15E family pectate lyase
VKYIFALFLFILFSGCLAQKPLTAIDETAEKMLLYQRNNGGWPQYKGDPTNYNKPMTDSLKSLLLKDKTRLDATIDDRSTSGEINYLMKAYHSSGNSTYLKAAEKGISYLLSAQNTAGGWPQFYPDSSSYRKHITYNDNAMIDVLWIIKKVAESTGDFRVVDTLLKIKAKPSLERGIDCILETQVIQHGKRTVWCAQHDSKTLQPAKARAFEPPSLSAAESVEIVRFLISIEHPSDSILTAIRNAVQWFQDVKIVGYDTKIVEDASQPSGRDRILVKDENSIIWARFYEIETFRPIFTGRNSQPKYSLEEIENERRVGYSFYGKWPKDLLQKLYPSWEAKNSR